MARKESPPGAPALPAVQAGEIDVDQLTPSPTNPRGAAVSANLGELTASVRVHGILQPILVRPRPETGTYEIVAGERRWRAARGAGLATIPARIRELSDQEVVEIQIIENLQRQDLGALEEAEGYRALHETHRYPVEAIAANIGKSKAYVYARLKLCELPDAAKKACRDGRLNPSVALLVARIPNERLQKEATKELLVPRFGEGVSYRDARDLIEQRFMLRLNEAPFPRGDAALVPPAGPCSSCPKRTGNQPELFGDIKSADVCTDPACFQAKADAHWARRRNDHKAAGGEVLAEKEAREVFHWGGSQATGYATLDEKAFDVGAGDRTYRQLLKKAGQELPVVLARNPHDGSVHEIVPRATLKAALRRAGLLKKEPAAEKKTGDGNDTGARAREARKLAAARAIEQILLAVSQQPADENYWRLLIEALAPGLDILEEVFKAHGWPWDKKAAYGADVRFLREASAGIEIPGLQALALELLLRQAAAGIWDTQDVAIESACQLYSIDLKALEAEARKDLAAAAKEKTGARKKGARAPAKSRPNDSTEENPDE